MSEVKNPTDITPLVNYKSLIQNRKSPYYDIVKFLRDEMAMHYQKSGSSEVAYTLNPRMLQEEIEKKIQSEKLTTVNVCRTVRALLYASGLQEDKSKTLKEGDFYFTTTTGGRVVYHIKTNNKTIGKIEKFAQLQSKLYSPSRMI